MTTLPAEKAAPDSTSHWQTESLPSLIDFILSRYHAPLRRDLPLFIERARQVESQSASSPLSPLGLAAHLEQVRDAVDSHLAKEEQILFPLILGGRGGHALMPIRVMMAEHDDHTENLRVTRTLTHDFALPADASAGWRDLYEELQRLEADLYQHIELENVVLFPRALEGER